MPRAKVGFTFLKTSVHLRKRNKCNKTSSTNIYLWLHCNAYVNTKFISILFAVFGMKSVNAFKYKFTTFRIRIQVSAKMKYKIQISYECLASLFLMFYDFQHNLRNYIYPRIYYIPNYCKVARLSVRIYLPR